MAVHTRSEQQAAGVQKGASWNRVLTNMQSALEKGAAFIGALCILALMLLTTVDVVGRYFFDHPIMGTYEVSNFLLVGIVFLGVAYVQSLKGHIKLEIFERLLSRKARSILDIFGNVVGLFVLSLMTWQAGILAWRAWQSREYVLGGIYQLPDWPVKAVLPFGIGLLCTRLIIDIIVDIAKSRVRENEP